MKLKTSIKAGTVVLGLGTGNVAACPSSGTVTRRRCRSAETTICRSRGREETLSWSRGGRDGLDEPLTDPTLSELELVRGRGFARLDPATSAVSRTKRTVARGNAGAIGRPLAASLRSREPRRAQFVMRTELAANFPATAWESAQVAVAAAFVAAHQSPW